MANPWTYEQKFNGLNTADLNGQDSWSGSTNFDVVTTDTPAEGTKHVKCNTISSAIDRIITAVTYGTMYFDMKAGQTNKDAYFVLASSAADEIDILFNSSGNITAYDSDSSYVTVQAYSANTYYRIGIAFDYTAGGWEGLDQYHFKVNVNGGAWSSEFKVEHGNTYSSIARVKFNNPGWNTGGTFYWDFISPDYSSTEIKSVNGLAKSSIKSINGLAIASIKNFNGLA